MTSGGVMWAKTDEREGVSVWWSLGAGSERPQAE